MKNITDNEIIKALECCIKADYVGDCIKQKCPMRTKNGCAYYLGTDEDDEHTICREQFKVTLDLINRQKAEIERLQRLLNESDKKYNLCAKRFFKEGVNGLADRLKRHWRLRAGIIPWYEIHEIIGNLVKEMVGE